MQNVSGIISVGDIMSKEKLTLSSKVGTRRPKDIELDNDRIYIVPGYQREIRWSPENVQVLLDDLSDGYKFLGTITLCTYNEKEYEVIDGQQRLTVIKAILYCMHERMGEKVDEKDYCAIRNLSFPYLDEALKYGFDYEKIKNENLKLYESIETTDVLGQKDDFKAIWDSIVARIINLEVEDISKLCDALKESEMNIIVNDINGKQDERKFCVDYFIDINNKSVPLDSLDIIRAYAFRNDFDVSTKKWADLQKKSIELSRKLKYPSKDLFFHYFICRVNKELGYSISSLSNDYTIKENTIVKGAEYAEGTAVWNIFDNDKFYSELLDNLIGFISFIFDVLSTEDGKSDKYKKYLHTQKGSVSNTFVGNSHSVINSILRNDDVVPKMMIMKYYLDVICKEDRKTSDYNCIYYINVIANCFTMGTKRKSSNVIASKLMQKQWADELRKFAINSYKEVPESIGFSNVVLQGGEVTKESAQYLARRYFAMRDSYELSTGGISINSETYKAVANSNNTTMEHFLINREYKYETYKEDGETVDWYIKLTGSNKKKMATMANYLIMEGDTNRKLRDRTVYEKIELLEKLLLSKNIESIIPSKTSRDHYYLIKKVFHDESQYPKKKIEGAKTKSEKKRILKEYYENIFEREYNTLVGLLRDDNALFFAEFEYHLVEKGFRISEDQHYIRDGKGIIRFFQIQIDYAKRQVELSAFFNKIEDDTADEVVNTACERLSEELGLDVRVDSYDLSEMADLKLVSTELLDESRVVLDIKDVECFIDVLDGYSQELCANEEI